MSTADKDGRITQALGDRLACLSIEMGESVNARVAGFDRLLDEATVDYLGPATPATRAEVKAARRTEQRKAAKEWATFWIALLVGAVLISVGSVIGNQRNVDVTDLWKFVPSLSRERAEPEESAK